ncbi:MAG: hypothetical protein INR70_13645 [Parafilimonas terrae]|nr:hypothetical protein [Parafilimonas terrae]
MSPTPTVPASRIPVTAFLWLLVAIGLATLNAPADLAATMFHLRVPDPDDAMRLVEVRDLVNGQGWYDLVQHRFGPPAGILSHWSRFVDAPLAAIVIAGTPFFGQPLAEGLAAAIWPSLLFGLYALILYRGIRARFGTRSALIGLLVATQTLGVTIQFAAGRVDHHDVQLTAILGLVLAIARGGGWAGLVAGLLGALSLAVGLEGLPFLAIGALFLTMDWVLRGRPALRAFLGFGLGLGLTTPLLFGGQTAPALWGRTACDALSPPWLYLAAAGAGLSLVCAGLDRVLTRRRNRILLVAGAGAAVVAGFASLFPICLSGPFTGMTELVRDHWLLKVNEMTNAATFIARGQWEALAFYPVVLLACLVATRSAVSGPQRRLFGLAAVMLWPGLILGLTEFRGLYVVSGLVPLVAGPFIDGLLARMGQGDAAPWRVWGNAAVAAGLISTAWIAPIALGETLLPQVRTASNPGGATSCLSDAALAPLAALPAGTVLAPVFMGPAILLHTPHTVVAAPYHRAVPNIAAALQGLGGTQDDLRRVSEAQGVLYLAACPARPADDIQDAPAFATLLARGETRADWLKPLPGSKTVKIWQVAP